MADEKQAELKKRYNAAVDSFILKIKDDPNIIAVIVCGSLAYDAVWEKSDIDMNVVVRDQHLSTWSYCIVEDGITINVSIVARSEFKRGMERNIGGSFAQSYISRGKIVYTSDESLYEYFEDIKRIGPDDIALTMFYVAGELVAIMDKCRKWLTAKKDPLYAQYFLLKSAETLSNMTLCLNSEPTSRQAIQKAMAINPDLIVPFYRDAMSHQLSEEEISDRIEMMDGFLEQNLDIIKKPVVEFMSDQQLKTITMITRRFHIESHFIIEIFDYLAEKGVIEKVSQTIRITPKGRQAVEEIGYLYIP